MKQLLAILFLLAAGQIFAQTNAMTSAVKGRSKQVSFVVKFDKNMATKDGYYLGGYVVDIDHNQAEKLDGKKIRITGKAVLVKGIKNDPGGKTPIRQGRDEDTKHILSPSIEIIKE